MKGPLSSAAQKPKLSAIAKSCLAVNVASTAFAALVFCGARVSMVVLLSAAGALALLVLGQFPRSWRGVATMTLATTSLVNGVQVAWSVLSFVSRVENVVSSLRSFEGVERLMVNSKNNELLTLKTWVGTGIVQLHRMRLYDHTFLLDMSTNFEDSVIMKMEEQEERGTSSEVCQIVVDIGAAEGILGSNSFFFVQKGMHAVLVEPDPLNQAIIKKNVVRHFPNAELVPAAVANRSGTATFYRTVDMSYTGGTLNREVNGKKTGSFEVKVISYADLVAQKIKPHCVSKGKPDTYFMLSIDAEGNEKTVLDQLSDPSLKPKPKYIVYEWARKQIRWGVPGYEEVTWNDDNVVLVKKGL